MGKLKIIVFIDAGHGGKDPGAVYKKLIEKEIVLVIAKKCKNVLQQYDIEVVMSRETDKFVELSERAKMANNVKAIYFVSIHCNAGGGDRGEVIHSIYRGKGLELSNKIAAELKAIGQTSVKEYDKKGTGGTDYYAVIRETNMDSVIVECAFLDNEIDNKIIDTVKEQELFGIAIAKGILKQCGIKYKESNISDKPVKLPTDPSKLYRIRKSWKDASSQIGAYKDLLGAKAECDKHKGYSVYDNSGVCVYPKPIIKEEYDMKKIVTYLGDADLFAAVMVAQKLGCPLMRVNDFKASGLKAKEVIQIGGNVNDTNRFSTMKNAANKYL